MRVMNSPLETVRPSVNVGVDSVSEQAATALSRRRFLRGAALAGGVLLAAGLAACAAPGAPTWTYPPASSPTTTDSPSVSPAAVSASPLGGETITLSEWKVAVASTIKSGTTDFTITNNGVAPHELLVFKSDLDPTAYPTDAAGDIKEEGAGVTLVSDGDNIDPAGSQARSIDLGPGKYLFVCNIPGHFKQGMFTVVNVTP
jgi:hypothetical protein